MGHVILHWNDHMRNLNSTHVDTVMSQHLRKETLAHIFMFQFSQSVDEDAVLV